MRRDQVLLYLATALFLSVALGCGFEGPRTQATRDQAMPPNTPAEQTAANVPPPRPERPVKDMWAYGGVVTALGPDWLEIGAGWRGSVETDRAGRQTVRENGDTKKPKRISTAGTRPGGDPEGEGLTSTTYWLSDLQIGDVVSIFTHEGHDGDEWTIHLLIRRRPGGKIPPIHGDLSNPPVLHLSYQAEQDWEEKGTPIPKKYLPPDGRTPWTNPPYPPVAPMPREGALTTP